eukprot:Blabericola_migrator_1__7542@NODE_3851_length_1467_cov_9_604286_g2167_i2_p1_GENE_NODE_3851_length_1467_cov_9_604286_g2167_i2NODE_3851_length_1467_cov_9_604286_g2167_i2_p1_ORF_typecomplete_len107_score1_71SOCS_box/PF07525_16/8_4_NODE_3851_length_1467_cov_9_604286_g2167_i272392
MCPLRIMCRLRIRRLLKTSGFIFLYVHFHVTDTGLLSSRLGVSCPRSKLAQTLQICWHPTSTPKFDQSHGATLPRSLMLRVMIRERAGRSCDVWKDEQRSWVRSIA